MGIPTSTEPTAAPTAAVKKSQKAWRLVVGIAAIVALAVLAGGALVSGALATSGRGGLFNRPEGERPDFRIVPAQELPTTAPNVRGVVTQRADQTISAVERGGFEPNAGANQPQGSNAPQVEVIVTSATVFYHDITRANLNEGAPSGTIQQKLETGSLDGITPNSRIRAWGDLNGQQLTARVLVYSDPIAFRQP